MVCLSLFATLRGFSSPQRKLTLWLFLSFNFGLLLLHFLVLSPVKPFMQFQRDITNGMTVQQVQRLCIQRFPKGGRFRQPEWSLGYASSLNDHGKQYLVGTPDQSLHYILDPTDGRYDAESLSVYFRDGKAVGTTYLGD
jgi:hypothetical protein